jgi:fructose-1,6-bisphosphatase/inositol monophosphatase family enzyme
VIPIDPERVAGLIEEAGATIVLPRHRQLEDSDIQEKRKGDLVTVADLEVERWLSERLGDLLPGSAVVGEEAVFADPGVMDRLASDEPVWIVDPIDGTWNFAHGRDAFAIIVALCVGGETVMGWIAEPALGSMAVGEHGGGVTLDGTAVAFAPSRSTDGPLHGTAARYLYERVSAADPRTIASVSRPSSAGHEYVLMLRGDRQFSAYTRLFPWDHAAGALLICEAGGVSRLLTGEPYDPRLTSGDLLTAVDGPTWRVLHDILR